MKTAARGASVWEATLFTTRGASVWDATLFTTINIIQSLTELSGKTGHQDYQHKPWMLQTEEHPQWLLPSAVWRSHCQPPNAAFHCPDCSAVPHYAPPAQACSKEVNSFFIQKLSSKWTLLFSRAHYQGTAYTCNQELHKINLKSTYIYVNNLYCRNIYIPKMDSASVTCPLSVPLKLFQTHHATPSWTKMPENEACVVNDSCKAWPKIH